MVKMLKLKQVIRYVKQSLTCIKTSKKKWQDIAQVCYYSKKNQIKNNNGITKINGQTK